MMTGREAVLAVLNHETADFMPSYFTNVVFCGGSREDFENGPSGGGLDGFGVKWHSSDTGGGQSVPEANWIVLDDVTKWRDVVQFPDLDAYDWEGEAARQKANYDPVNQILEYHAWNSQFLRVTHLMGFENGLCAFAEEPEACRDLMEAITDYKIRLIERAAHYFKPDSFVNYDDVATSRNLFLSRKTYQELVKPCHKRMNDAAKAYGMLPQQHCCGYCEDLIEDFIEEGSVGWQSAQPCNDICRIIETYGDRITVMGGYDTQGLAGMYTATGEQIRNEVTRCMEEYGKYGRHYIFQAFLLGDRRDSTLPVRESIVREESLRQSMTVWK